MEFFLYFSLEFAHPSTAPTRIRLPPIADTLLSAASDVCHLGFSAQVLTIAMILGWSVRDLFAAITIINKAGEALDETRGQILLTNS
jgi:hypothetical protein